LNSLPEYFRLHKSYIFEFISFFSQNLRIRQNKKKLKSNKFPIFSIVIFNEIYHKLFSSSFSVRALMNFHIYFMQTCIKQRNNFLEWEQTYLFNFFRNSKFWIWFVKSKHQSTLSKLKFLPKTYSELTSSNLNSTDLHFNLFNYF
jgi:hypothetical protein